jgi:hypothetical protein
MRVRVVAVVLFVLLVASCQTAPPTMVVLVVTSTPEATTAASATPAAPTPDSAIAGSSVTTSPALPSPTPTIAVTATLAPTATVNVFPTPTIGEIQVAEQLFQNGRMFWVQPTGQLWVLAITGEGRGTWTIYPDTFEDGVDPEVDPNLVPPDGLLQPARGFGKLWRMNQRVREQLGWATTPEFGYFSGYEYHPGGTVNAQGVYEPGPGYHILYSLYREQFRFNESDSTWQLGGG